MNAENGRLSRGALESGHLPWSQALDVYCPHGVAKGCPREVTHKISMSEDTTSGPMLWLSSPPDVVLAWLTILVDCGLTFWSTISSQPLLTSTFQSPSESDLVAQRQNLEDVQPFGARSPPSDAIEYINSDKDRYSQLANDRLESRDLLPISTPNPVRETTEHPMDEQARGRDESGGKDQVLQVSVSAVD